jgi:predicted dienelactone hydrolase
LARQIRREAQSALAPETAEIAGVHVSIWRPTGAGQAPLIVFSHGFHGTSTQSKFLMKALSDHGYLVIAPNHKDAGMGSGTRPQVGFGKADEWSESTYKDRADDIRSILAALREDSKWAKAIDWSKVGLAGHSLGGYTVLGLSGAWASWKLPEVKAVLALSPYASPFVQKKTLGGMHVPVMYQTGTRDFGIGPFLTRKGGAYELTPSPAYLVDFSEAGHLAWTDLRSEYQASVAHYSLAFFDRYLKGDRNADLASKRSDVAELDAK